MSEYGYPPCRSRKIPRSRRDEFATAHVRFVLNGGNSFSRELVFGVIMLLGKFDCLKESIRCLFFYST